MSDVNLHLNIIHGEVVITFGQPVSWIGFTPKGAREMAESLKKMAAEAEQADDSKPAGISIQ